MGVLSTGLDRAEAALSSSTGRPGLGPSPHSQPLPGGTLFLVGSCLPGQQEAAWAAFTQLLS